MKTDLLKHIQQHEKEFRAWIGAKSELQLSDVLTPLVEPYETENNTKEVSNGNCKSCILDMVRWAVSKLKKEETKPKAK